MSLPSTTTDTPEKRNLIIRREMIIEVVKSLHYKISGTSMPIYGVPNKFLKDYVTSKSDRKKNKFKIPEQQYRLKDEDFKAEQPVIQGLEMINPKEYKKLYQKSKEETASLEDFVVISVLGKGSVGKVFLVQRKQTKKYYAMKVLRKDVLIDTDLIENTRIEKEILKRASHPFIVSMEFVFQTPGRIYFIMQYVKGGELFKQLAEKKRLPEMQAKFYAAQIALALGHLHKNKIIYRDVKPENILLDENGYIYLTDFGMAKFLNEDQTANSFCGTPEYLAPEIITGEGHNKPADWWSLGTLIYEMLVGIPPFYHQNQKVMYNFIMSKSIIFPEAKYNIPISDECKDIISQLLIKDQKSRLGSKGDAEEVMSHPFFKLLDFTKLYIRRYRPHLFHQ